VPSSPLRVLVGRYAGPGFTRGELDRCATVLSITADVIRLAYRDATAAAPSETTQALLSGEPVGVMS
jgi:hypothetical protein